MFGYKQQEALERITTMLDKTGIKITNIKVQGIKRTCDEITKLECKGKMHSPYTENYLTKGDIERVNRELDSGPGSKNEKVTRLLEFSNLDIGKEGGKTVKTDHGDKYKEGQILLEFTVRMSDSL